MNRAMGKLACLFFASLLLVNLVACRTTPTPEQRPQLTAGQGRLILATTTSTADSGLLDFILPDFEQTNNVIIDVIAVGTGQALALGRKGDVDLLLVHNRQAEEQFVAEGHARERFDVMYNDFVLVGPPDDPAGIAGMASAGEAFRAIAAAQATFVSRGDGSGTQAKELSIWHSAGITPTARMSWYKAIGQGMGDTLLFADEQRAYTLVDRGTYLSMRDRLPGLIVLLGGERLADNKDELLLNPYGVMAVNPDRHPGVNYDLAMKLIAWLLSPEVQDRIGQYGLNRFGQPLFYTVAPTR